MIKKRLLLVAALVFMAGFNYSCDKDSASETEEEYNSIRKSEIDDEDDT